MHKLKIAGVDAYANQLIYRPDEYNRLIAASICGREYAVRSLVAHFLLDGMIKVEIGDDDIPVEKGWQEFAYKSQKISENYCQVVLWNKESRPRVIRSQDFFRFIEKNYTVPFHRKWSSLMWKIATALEAIERLECYGTDAPYYLVSLSDNMLQSMVLENISQLKNLLGCQGVKKSGKNKTEGMSLKAFLETFEEELSRKISEKMNPVFDPNNMDRTDEAIEQRVKTIALRTPFLAQTHIVTAAVKHFTTGGKTVLLTAEMGCGKTLMSILAAAQDPVPGRHIVMCPPHLVRKWVQEIAETIPKNVGVGFNLNGKECIRKLKMLPKTKPKRHEFYIIGRERVKSGFGWKHCTIKRKNDAKFWVDVCPNCGEEVAPDQWRATKKNYCSACNGALWQADRGKIRRYSPAEYIKRHFPKGYFKTLIADELHELKGESAQGVAFGQLCGKVEQIIGLTGTLLGGYADDIFYLLWSSVPRQMVAAGERHGKKQAFIEKYGVIEKVYRAYDTDNAYTRSMRLCSVRRRPGISPVVLSRFLIPNALFMKLQDISDSLPPYEERVLEVKMDPAVKKVYNRFEGDLQDALKKALEKRDYTILGRMLQALLSWPDGCRKTEDVYNKEGEIIATAQAVPIDTTQKEQKLIQIVKDNIRLGRKTLVYAEFTGTRDILPTIVQQLEKDGIRSLVLKSTVQAEKRQKWIEDHLIQADFDVLLCNPKLVQTGLDLIDFPEIIFFQTGYSIYVLRQASRRSWRIGQGRDVRVSFLCNQGTMQARAMNLIAKKLETALAIEGDLTDQGLVALSDGGGVGSLVIELAKSLLQNECIKGVETVWTDFRKKEFKASTDIGKDIEELVKLNTQVPPKTLQIVQKPAAPFRREFNPVICVQLSLFGN